MNKEETRLWNEYDKCRTRKCSKLIKKRDEEAKSFHKEERKKCTQKNVKAFSDCSWKLFDGSKLEKLSQKVVKCSKKRCYTQKKKLNKYRNK